MGWFLEASVSKQLIPIVLVAVLGCDQLSSKTQAVAVLTRTPSLAEANGMSAELAAALPLSALDQNGATGIAFALGERESLTSTTITPIGNANITVSWSGVTVGLCAQRGVLGTYTATSVSADNCGDARLAYEQNALYTFDVETSGNQYTVRVVAPPLLRASDVTFEPALSAITNVNGAQLRRHVRTTPLKIDWSNASVSEPAFITVFRIEYVGSGGDDALEPSSWRLPAEPNPVFENGPRSIGEYVNLIFNDNPQTAFTIPREVFARPGLYLTVVSPVAVATDISNNLSLGSGAVAGAGTAFAFWVP